MIIKYTQEAGKTKTHLAKAPSPPPYSVFQDSLTGLRMCLDRTAVKSGNRMGSNLRIAEVL